MKSWPVPTDKLSRLLTRASSGGICIFICLGYFFVGLWPFNFHARNKVEWLPDFKGVHFEHFSAVYSASTIDFSGAVASPSTHPECISIELCIRPGHGPTRGILPILSLYGTELRDPLLIRQRMEDLLVRTHVPDVQGRLQYQEVPIDAGLRNGERRTLVITLGRTGTIIHVDGVLLRAFPTMALKPEAFRGRLILGNIPEGDRGWVGDVFGLAVFSRPLTTAEIAHHFTLWTSGRSRELQSEPGIAALYYFNEGSGRTIVDHSPWGHSLLIPEYYHVLRKTVLAQPRKDSINAFDVVVNIVGFVPFGFFCFIYLAQIKPGRIIYSSVLAILISAVISTVIELIQVFLPSRFSSLTDLMCNTAGAIIGVILACLATMVLVKTDLCREQREGVS